MKNGFIVLDRKILDWKYHDLPAAFSLWIHILMEANWKDGFFLGEPIPRGSLAISYRRLADEVGVDIKTVRKYLQRFAEDGMIEIESTQRFTRIKVLNYSAYQDLRDDTRPTPNPTVIPTPSPTQTPTQTPTRSPYNITKKQEEQSNNIPPYIPPRGNAKKRRERSGIRIDTPEWYKKQQSGDLDVSEADPEETEAIIAEIEDMKRRMNEQ